MESTFTDLELTKRANKFVRDWKKQIKKFEGIKIERKEAQPFWEDFFEIFGIDRKEENIEFEKSVKNQSGNIGKIDVFWEGKMIIEHKSIGEDLEEAFKQAKEYWFNLPKELRPQYFVVSDFSNFFVYDDTTQKSFDITLIDLPKSIHKFSRIISGYKINWDNEEEVNNKATKLMIELHDSLLKNGYAGHQLERFLVRILFCLFAEDTSIFKVGSFEKFIREQTKPDGTDIGAQLNSLFDTLNTKTLERYKNISDSFLGEFDYVNGELFSEPLKPSYFSKEQRDLVLKCCDFNWSAISPVIFGSMFQYATDKEKRKNLQAHYTSEKNIIKVIRSLFLDELYQELESIKENEKQLEKLRIKISSLKFLDPACGCGNFLIIAYRELRLLEIELLKCLFKRKRQYKVGAEFTSTIRLDSFYGIELEEFPAQIAQTAMWLMEHKMNLKMNEELSGDVNTLPLKKSATIRIGNALRIDWNEVISNQEISFILANPPFISKKERDEKQVEDMKIVTKENTSVLDYVCAWYVKASEYIQGTNIKCAFVSTNSIVQGEQVGELWRFLMPQNIHINFAHRTFKWSNELKGEDSASVYCVIIGFANYSEPIKKIYHYEKPNTPEPQLILAKNINPYLIDSENIIVEDRRNTLFNAPKIYFGNMPNDDKGKYIFTDKEYWDFIAENPKSKILFKPFISNREFLYGKKMWCLWLKDVEPSVYNNIKPIMERVQAVSRKRTSSKREATNKIPAYLFGEIRQQLIKEKYLLIPRHTSENRIYIPFDFFNKNEIVGDTCLFIPDATLYDFGILTSLMHMGWMRVVCGRLESRYRYSNNLVYNNFPFPENVSDELKKQVSEKAKYVLDTRKKYPNSTPDDLYDPDTMQEDLKKAHNELDKLVDKCYGKMKFENELDRVRFLFGLYKAKVEPLNFIEERKVKKSKVVS